MKLLENYDIAIIGGGPAGLAAAIGANEAGADKESIIVIERDDKLGGILNQCIHNGFGLHTFKEELTGPEYAGRFIDKLVALDIPYVLNTMVVDIAEGENGTKLITTISKENGLKVIKAKAVVLSMGCRERSRGALNIPGFRPAGVFSAGTAQRLVNIESYMPGKEVVILGSGDIGLIMARRLTLEGAKVKVVAELQPYSGGLKRNIVQCLDDYGIPLKLSHTVTRIDGKERVEGVEISRVDERLKPIKGTEEYYKCDTLLLSVGLIPENELSDSLGVKLSPITSGPVVNESLETSVEGVFACGNVLHVHDLVDFVSEEAKEAGKNAAKFAKFGKTSEENTITLTPENGVRYTVPSTICPENMNDSITVRFRVANVFKNKYVAVYFDGERVKRTKKMILAPGEMESVVLKKEDLLNKGIKNIKICLED